MASGQRAWSASSPDVVTAGVRAAAEAHRAVAVEELLEESAAGQPHPAARVHAEVCIQEQLIEHLDGAGWAISLLGTYATVLPKPPPAPRRKEPKPFCWKPPSTPSEPTRIWRGSPGPRDPTPSQPRGAALGGA